MCVTTSDATSAKTFLLQLRLALVPTTATAVAGYNKRETCTLERHRLSTLT
jgi:hypothetical protein